MHGIRCQEADVACFHLHRSFTDIVYTGPAVNIYNLKKGMVVDNRKCIPLMHPQIHIPSVRIDSFLLQCNTITGKCCRAVMLPHIREFRIVFSQFSVAFKGQRRLQQFPFTRLINFFHDLFLLCQREQLSQRSFFHFIFPLYLCDDNVLDLL